MAAVEAGLKGASVSITELGRTLSGPAHIKHKIKRMDRLAGNCHLITERTAIYGAMTQWLLQSLLMPLILIDWSPLTADQHQQLLRAALPTGGRSVAFNWLRVFLARSNCLKVFIVLGFRPVSPNRL